MDVRGCFVVGGLGGDERVLYCDFLGFWSEILGEMESIKLERGSATGREREVPLLGMLTSKGLFHMPYVLV